MAKILIIEDNNENLDLMVYLLNKSGYHIITAMDGKKGLALCYQERPDLIICDIQIPEIDGLTVIRRLKSADDQLSRIPIIAITAFAMVGDKERILSSGCNGYISKPLQPEIFVSQIELYLPKNKIINSFKFEQEDRTPYSPIMKSEQDYKGTILILDDNPADLYLSETLMRSIQLRPLLAKTINEAIKILALEVPHLILSDFHLDKQSALDFLDFLNSRTQYNNIPFILISSSITQEQRHLLLYTKNITSVLSRPIEPEKFIDAIENIWKNHCLNVMDTLESEKSV